MLGKKTSSIFFFWKDLFFLIRIVELFDETILSTEWDNNRQQQQQQQQQQLTTSDTNWRINFYCIVGFFSFQSAFFGQFHQHFRIAFVTIFLRQKKFKPKMSIQKSYARNFCTKMPPVKCWWNWQLVFSFVSTMNKKNIEDQSLWLFGPRHKWHLRTK